MAMRSADVGFAGSTGAFGDPSGVETVWAAGSTVGAAGTAAGGGLALDHLDRQTRPGADDRGAQPVGAASDDGDVNHSAPPY